MPRALPVPFLTAALVACPQAVEPQPASQPAPVREAAPTPAPSNDRTWTGLCDASAALVDGDRLLVANDEDNALAIYDLAGGAPLGHLDVGGPLGVERELDLEGAALLGDTAWWIGSHGRSSSAKVRPERSVLVPTDRDGALAGGPIGDLLGAMLEAVPRLAEHEPLPPKEGGINVEGLAGKDGLLWVGLRSPVLDGLAQVFRVDVSQGTARIDDVLGVDLGGHGIRSLEWSPRHEAFWIVGGPPGPVGTFALYRWEGPGGTPTRVDADLGGLQVEALAVLPDALLVLADDGGSDRGGESCKDRWKDNPADPRVWFGGRILPL